MADANSRIAWHRVQLKKNREALKALEVARFKGQHDKVGDTERAMFVLERKIAEVRKMHRRARAPDPPPAGHRFLQPQECELGRLERA